MKSAALLLLLTSYLILVPSRSAEPEASTPRDSPFHMEPAQLAGWWYLGDTVTYRVAGAQFPADLHSLSGVITDVDGKAIDHVSVSGADLKEKGWQWIPKAPGFYEVTFSYSRLDGTRRTINQSFVMKGSPTVFRTFSRSESDFAVLSVPSGDPATPVGQFGFDYGSLNQVPLAKLIGFDLARLTIGWGANFTNLKGGVESIKGEDHWELYDPAIDLLFRSRMVINAQFNYTPLWASPHPEKTNINICVVEGTTYAPKNLKDFGRFVEKAASRYKDRIHLWEIWNEQSVPGGSLFWADTSAHYFQLLKTGYDAIKHIQPESEVWLGGMGPRAPYYAFYNELLKMGGDKYFDVLSLHGAWNSPVDHFYPIDTTLGRAHKPAVEGEWHAILLGSHRQSNDPIVADEALSLKMMKDLLYQLKGGVKRTILFEMTNLAEKETLEFATEQNMFVHSSGLFRHLPQIEPRHPAVVMANFLELTGRKATFVKEFKLSTNTAAVQLATWKGPLVLVWSEKGDLDLPSIRTLATPRSELHDWEGKQVTLDPAEPLPENKVYYLSFPNVELIARAESTNLVVAPHALVRVAPDVPENVYIDGPLFASVDLPAAVPESAWIRKDWKLTTLIPTNHEEDFSTRAAFGANAAGMDIVIEVRDKTQSQTESQPGWWKSDSVQIAFDCEGTGLLGGTTEIIAALTDTGPQLWKTVAADPMGDIPAHWSPANGSIRNAEKQITRVGDITRYQIRLPWSELYPLTYDTSKPLRMALVVNNGNGKQRAEYLEWGGGISGRERSPSLYGRLKPLPKR